MERGDTWLNKKCAIRGCMRVTCYVLRGEGRWPVQVSRSIHLRLSSVFSRHGGIRRDKTARQAAQGPVIGAFLLNVKPEFKVFQGISRFVFCLEPSNADPCVALSPTGVQPRQAWSKRTERKLDSLAPAPSALAGFWLCPKLLSPPPRRLMSIISEVSVLERENGIYGVKIKPELNRIKPELN